MFDNNFSKCLTPKIMDLVYSITNTCQSRQKIAFMALMAVLSTLSQGKFDVLVDDKRGHCYKVPLTFMGILVAESGEGKGPVFQKLLAPLDELVETYNVNLVRKNQEAVQYNKLIKIKIKAIEKELTKNSCDIDSAQSRIMELSKQFKQLTQPMIAYFTNGTEAGIRKAIGSQIGKRLSVIDVEGSLSKLLISDNKLISLLNQGYSVKPIQAARSSDKNIMPIKGTISTILCMQSDKFEQFYGRYNIWGEGFLPRVLPLYIGQERELSMCFHSDQYIYNEYKSKVEYLFKYTCDISESGYFIPKTLKIDDDAFKELWNFSDNNFRNDDYIFIKQWIDKAKTLMCKLAALFHIYEVDGDPSSTIISRKCIYSSLDILKYVLPYVRDIRSHVSPTANEITLKKIIHWLYSRYGTQEFTLRELYHSAGLKEGLVRPCISLLLEQRVLIERFPSTYSPSRSGRPPSRCFYLDWHELTRRYPDS